MNQNMLPPSRKALWIFAAVLAMTAMTAIALVHRSSKSPYRQLDTLLEYSQKLKLSAKGDYKIHPSSASFIFNGQEFKTNSLGLRGPDVPGKSPGSYRFAVVGSWLAAGIGLPDYASIPGRLEYYLNDGIKNKTLPFPERKYEVLNLAVGGNNLAQQAALLRDLGPQLQLDAVLLIIEPSDLSLSPADVSKMTAPGFWERSLEIRSEAVQIPTFSGNARGILDDNNWRQLRAEVSTLRGQVSPALNVDIIPVFLPTYKIDSKDREDLNIAVTDMFAHEGYFSCKMEEDATLLPRTALGKELFLGSDAFSQNISAQLLNCLGLRGVRD